MATKKQSSPPKEEVGSDGASPSTDPLASEAGCAWLAEELKLAEFEEANGPSGAGWPHNEGLRPAITERAEFLRALIQKL